MSTKTNDKVFIVTNKNGMPMYGTKVCSNKGAAARSMAPHLDSIIWDRVGYDTHLGQIHRKAQKGYGVPKVIHDRAIDGFVDEMRHKPDYQHKHGNKAITRSLVEDYNAIIEEITDTWFVAEVGANSPYKVLKIDLCEDCGGWYDVRYANNDALKQQCRNCRRP